MADIQMMLDTYERDHKRYSELLVRAKAARASQQDAARIAREDEARRVVAREEAARVVQGYAARQARDHDARRISAHRTLHRAEARIARKNDARRVSAQGALHGDAARVAAQEHEARVAREVPARRELEADLDENISQLAKSFGSWTDEPKHTLRAEDLRLTRYSRVRHREIVTDTCTCKIRNIGRIMHTVLYSESTMTNALEEVVKLADKHENDDVKRDDGSYAANEFSLAIADKIPNGTKGKTWYVVNDRAEAQKQQWCLGSVPVSDVRLLEDLLSTECNSKIKRMEISDATHPAYRPRDETLHVNGGNVGYMTVAKEYIREGDFVEFYDKHAYTFNEEEASELDVSVLNELCVYMSSSFMKVYFQMLKRIDDTSYSIDIAKGDFRMLGDRTKNCTCTINDPGGLTGEANVAPVTYVSRRGNINTLHVVYVAKSDIPKGAELLVQYGRDFWDDHGSSDLTLVRKFADLLKKIPRFLIHDVPPVRHTRELQKMTRKRKVSG